MSKTITFGVFEYEGELSILHIISSSDLKTT